MSESLSTERRLASLEAESKAHTESLNRIGQTLEKLVEAMHDQKWLRDQIEQTQRSVDMLDREISDLKEINSQLRDMISQVREEVRSLKSSVAARWWAIGIIATVLGFILQFIFSHLLK